MIDQLEKSNPDIANFVKSNDKRLKRRFYIISLLVMIFYIMVVYSQVLDRKGAFWALIIIPIIPAAVFILVGGLHLFDPAFEGKVTKVVFSVRLEVGNKAGGGVGRGGRSFTTTSSRQVNYTKFFVTDRYGKKHRYAVQLPDNRIDLGITVGDTVRKYHGLPYPILLKNPTSICPVCGSANQKNDPYCYDCGFSILKNV